MNRIICKRGFFVFYCFVILGFGLGASDRVWVNLSDAENVNTYIKEETTSGIVAALDFPGFYFSRLEAAGQVFQRLEMGGHGTLTEPGKPELPFVSVLLEVPHDVTLEVEVVKENFEIRRDHRIYPYQEPLLNGAAEPPALVLDNMVYDSSRFYPPDAASIEKEDMAVIRGHRLVFLKVYPVQFNPAEGELKAYSHLEIRVTYNRGAQIEDVPSRLASPVFEELLERFVLNYKKRVYFNRFNRPVLSEEIPFESFAAQLDSTSRTGVVEGADYLILTRRSLCDSGNPDDPLVRFRNWKRRKGLKAEILFLDDLPDTDEDGAVSSGDIMAFTRKMYHSWNPVPAYLLLAGDAGDEAGNPLVPPFYGTSDKKGTSARGSDLYYGTLDGNDLFPDIFVGRIPAGNPVDLKTSLEKIMLYEQNPPPGGEFYDSLSLISSFNDTVGGSDGKEDLPWIQTQEELREYLYNQGYHVERIYSARKEEYSPQSYENGILLPLDLQPYRGFNWNGKAEDISRAINLSRGGSGRFLLSFLGEGERSGWIFPGFGKSHIESLENREFMPLLISAAGGTGWFDNETDGIEETREDSFCEAFLLHPGGGVASIGEAGFSPAVYRHTFLRGIYHSIWPGYLGQASPGRPAVSSGIYRLGQVLTGAKIFTAGIHPPRRGDSRVFAQYHLLGDPEMTLLNRAPRDFLVTLPPAIGSGENQDFVIAVKDWEEAPVEGAVISITRQGEQLFSGYTGPGGIARFTGSFTPGLLDVTVTAPFFRPFMEILEVKEGKTGVTRLSPRSVPGGGIFHAGGKGFYENENVRFYLEDEFLDITPAVKGEAGLIYDEEVKLRVPEDMKPGLYNLILEGEDSGRYGVDVFEVTKENAVDLAIYSQWDSSTWSFHEGDNPTWNNPDINFHAGSAERPFSDSGNLWAGQEFTIATNIRNLSSQDCEGAVVSFKWAPFGVFPVDWKNIGSVSLDVPAGKSAEAYIEWSPPDEGGVSIRVSVSHKDDINPENNTGVENSRFFDLMSNSVLPFEFISLPGSGTPVTFEVRQLSPRYRTNGIVSTSLNLTESSSISLDRRLSGELLVQSVSALDHREVKAEFVITAYREGEIIGGVNFRGYKWPKTFSAGGAGGVFISLDSSYPLTTPLLSIEGTILILPGIDITIESFLSTGLTKEIDGLVVYLENRFLLGDLFALRLRGGMGFFRRSQQFNGTALSMGAVVHYGLFQDVGVFAANDYYWFSRGWDSGSSGILFTRLSAGVGINF